MWVEQLPSGRWRGGFRAAGRKYSQTFDYEYEAAAWATEAEARATGAAELATPARPAEAAPILATAPVAVDLGPTIGDHGLDYLARRRGLIEPGTYANYRTAIHAIIRTGIGTRRMGEVKRSDVQRWVTAMVDAGDGRVAINSRLKMLGQLYNDAMQERLTNVSPTVGVAYLSTDKGPDRVLDRAEESRLLAAAPAVLVAPILVGLDAGLRWQEVYALRASSVSPEHLDVSAAVARTKGRDGSRIKPYTKDGESRVVPVGTDRLADALEAAAKAARDRGGRDALLFTNRAGGVMHYNNHRVRLWVPAVTKAKIDDPPGFHGLRHTFATRLAADGVPTVEIAELLGHASTSTTERYVHAGEHGRRLTLVRAALAAA